MRTGPLTLRPARLALAALALPVLLGAQGAPDPQLLRFINAIRAVDNHAHVRAVIDGLPGAGPQKLPLGESWPVLEERLRSSKPIRLAPMR